MYCVWPGLGNGPVATEETAMNKEVKLLNLVSVLSALGFIAFAVFTALFYPPLLSIDNLFIISVCMVMALVFMFIPLLYLKEEGKLPIPFAKRLQRSGAPATLAAASGPPLLDAKGRAMPADVKSMVANMNLKQPKDS
jgi:amino acid transporter